MPLSPTGVESVVGRSAGPATRSIAARQVTRRHLIQAIGAIEAPQTPSTMDRRESAG
jgi:hypothetical protein